MDTTDNRQRVSLTVDEQGLATLSLNRPEKHNAFDDAVIAALSAHLDSLHRSSDARVLVLRSDGKTFSAGADIAWMQRMAAYDYDDNLRDAEALAEMLRLLQTLPLPSIARVQGNAFGGALGLICCCDIALAAENACFALTEARIGLIPATIGPYVIEAVGARWARRLFLTAERIDAAQAASIGLIHESCSGNELDSRLEALTRELLRNSPAAVREAKTLVRDLAGRPVDAALIADTSARIARQRVSEEGQEGLRAFLQKRSPSWAVRENS